jgi:hypothetical protein
MADLPSLRLRSLLVLAALGVAWPVKAIGPGTTSRNDFQTEAEATRHCHGRPVVWVVPANHIYYYQGEGDYGRGEQGAYMCEDEARGDLNRPAKNKIQAPP